MKDALIMFLKIGLGVAAIGVFLYTALWGDISAVRRSTGTAITSTRPPTTVAP